MFSLPWLIINNPQPNLYSGDTSIQMDTCHSPEGVPWICICYWLTAEPLPRTSPSKALLVPVSTKEIAME